MTQNSDTKKQQLISFIQWKLSHDKNYLNEIMPQLQQMSFSELTIWATKQDLID